MRRQAALLQLEGKPILGRQYVGLGSRVGSYQRWVLNILHPKTGESIMARKSSGCGCAGRRCCGNWAM